MHEETSMYTHHLKNNFKGVCPTDEMSRKNVPT